MEGLYAIVDLPHGHGLSAGTVARAVLGDRPEGGIDGASVVQMRAKGASAPQRLEWAREVHAECRAVGVPLLINDHLDVALAVGAEGVHLGQGDPGAADVRGVREQARASGRDEFLVGLSTHDRTQLRDGGRQSPDYLAYGPVRATGSKRNHEPTVGFEGLLDAARAASRPLVAIGGLDAEGGAKALKVGASAVAVIGALRAPEPAAIRAAAIELARSFREAARPLSLDEVARRIPVLEAQLLGDLARWGDSLGTQLQLKLPARFRPWIDEDGQPRYRPCHVVDLLHALGKRSSESWEQWHARSPDEAGPVVQLRRR